MTAVLLVFLVLYASADEVKNLRRSSKIEGSSRIAKTATSYVVNHEFCFACLSGENWEGKETLEEVHTYGSDSAGRGKCLFYVLFFIFF